MINHPKTFLIFILTSLLADLYSQLSSQDSNESIRSFILPAVEAGSKSSKGTSKTTVIAIDGGGGGAGKAHPVPVPWPVVHCHHHHHHMKYVPKPVLVHHWVKKSKYSPEELAATSMDEHLMPMSIPGTHQTTSENQVNMEQIPVNLAVGSETQILNTDSSLPFDGLMLGSQMVSSLNNAINLPTNRLQADYASMNNNQLSAKNQKFLNSSKYNLTNIKDVDSIDSLLNFALLSSNSTRSNGSEVNSFGKPNHPFKGPFDQLREESQHQKRIRLENLVTKLNRANEMEERQARLTFDKLSTEHAGRLVALQAMNRIIGANRQLMNPSSAVKVFSPRNPLLDEQKLKHQPGMTMNQLNSRTMSESRAIELMTKLVEQVAQTEAKKLLSRAAQRSAATAQHPIIKKQQTSEKQDQHNNEPRNLLKKSSTRLRAIFVSPFKGDIRDGGKRRRNSASPFYNYNAFSQFNAWPQYWQRQPNEAYTMNDGSLTGMDQLDEGAESVQLGQVVEPPSQSQLSTTPGKSITPSTDAPTMMSSTMNPDSENNFYMSQRAQLFKQQPTLFYTPQSSDIHNLIAEPPQLTSSSVRNVTQFSSDNPNDPAGTQTNIRFWPQTQEQQLNYENQFAVDQLMPYLEFPLSAQEWSAEAFRSVNQDHFNSASSTQSKLPIKKQTSSSSDDEREAPTSEGEDLIYELDGTSSAGKTNSQTGGAETGAEASQVKSFRQPMVAGNWPAQSPLGMDSFPLNQPVSPATMMALSDPLYVDASADMNQLRQFQSALNSGQLVAGNLTDMTQLSRGLRDQMRTLQGARGLPQVPNIPQPPQIPNLPMPPPGMMMQMAGLALPFAMARATRQNRVRQTQQVNAAASAGGSTAVGPRQRLFNRALSLTNRFARPRPRRPTAPTSSSSSSSSSSSASSRPSSTSIRTRTNLATVLRTVADMSRRAPLSALPISASSSSTKIKPKVDEAGGTALLGSRSRRLSRGINSYFSDKQHNFSDILHSNQRAIIDQPTLENTQYHHLVMPGSLLATLNDGSLAQFHSMNSPVDLLTRELGRHSTNRLSRSFSSGHHNLNNVSAYGFQVDMMRPRISDGSRLAPVVANHINLLLINAQNVTQGHPTAHSHLDQTKPSSSSMINSQGMTRPDSIQSTLELTRNHQVEQQQQHPEFEFISTTEPANTSVSEQQQQQQQQQTDLTRQPDDQSPVSAPEIEKDSNPESSTLNRVAVLKPTLKPLTALSTTTVTSTGLPHIHPQRPVSNYEKPLSDKEQQAKNKSTVALRPHDYVRAIKTVQEVAYPWPPPTKTSAYTILKT